MAEQKRGLGKKNLNALLADALGTGFRLQAKPQENKPKPEATPEPELEPVLTVLTPNKQNLVELDVKKLHPGKYQPRKDIQDSDLESLAASIKTQGVLQPLVVREDGSDYEIIAGERRWRAAQQAGLTTVPVLVREVPDEVAIAIALIENIQRENLNPLEEAVALERLSKELDLTHEKVAEMIGKSRTHVTNLLRLISLNDDVKILLERGDLEMGHAKALLSLKDAKQSQVAREVVAKSLSVRETESLVQKVQAGMDLAQINNTAKNNLAPMDPDIKQLQNKLANQLGASVKIQHVAGGKNKGKGKLIIKYNTLDELEGILAHIQ